MTRSIDDPSRRRLAQAIVLNEGFQVCFVFGPADAAQELVATATADAARSKAEATTVAWFLPRDALVPYEGERIREPHVWVLDTEVDEDAAVSTLSMLNRGRDTMATHPRTTLIVLLRESDAAIPLRAAPDLWSIRTLALSVSQEAGPDAAALAEWASDCDAAFQRNLALRPEFAQRYELGTYSFAYQVWPASPVQSTRRLRELMRGIAGWTGWRPWWVPENKYRPYSADDGVLECWMVGPDSTFADPAHSDFWRASASGSMFLRRGYDEDSNDKLAPGTAFSRNLPVWRAGEALFHAQQVAERLVEGYGRVRFSATWAGLEGRTTTEWPGSMYGGNEPTTTQRSAVSSVIETDPDELREDLLGVLGRLLQPLYDAFLEEPSQDYLARHLDEMRRRPVRAS